jgi:16S rRNA (adenine1518-N6/adenine1519-N6)-dimethyltransferase
MNEEEYFKVISEYKLLAKHEVGQNFLIDQDTCKRIVSLLNLEAGDQVLEIGSGAGSLSFFLANENANAHLIDIDEGLVTKLKNDFVDKTSIQVEQANILKYDVTGFNKVLGNLPYYITSAIMERLALYSPKGSRLVLMVQKEVFARLNAKVSEDGYGPLPILLAYRGVLKRQFIVPRTCFTPMPHVDSLVFSIDILIDGDKKAKDLYALCNSLFLHKRKTIFNNLQAYLSNKEMAQKVLIDCQIPLTKRPQDVTIGEYLKLLDVVNQKKF